jgi:tRNA U34 2-thiouridine synthase MnmA/TrmU
MEQNHPDIAVRYIFRRPFWKDNVYGSGLTFTTDQVRTLPHDLARKFLRHTDTFEEVTGEAGKAKPKTAEQETAEAVQADKKKKAEQATREQDLHDLHDQLGQMNKESVLRFAAEKFNTPLDKKHSVDQLRLEAKALVDRFGVP